MILQRFCWPPISVSAAQCDPGTDLLRHVGMSELLYDDILASHTLLCENTRKASGYYYVLDSFFECAVVFSSDLRVL